jgi:hypothetical protein
VVTLADLKTGNCSKCFSRIYWLPNDNTGKAAPIDINPDPDGPVIVTTEGGQVRYHVLTKDELAAGVDVTRYTNHFQTCPNSSEFRSNR